MDWYEYEVRDLEQITRANAPLPDAIAFYGSSSIRLWTTLGDDFPDLPVVNLGFGGSTLEACAYFFDRLIPPCRPRAIVFYAGDNDLGDGRSPEQVLDSFRSLRSKVVAIPGGVRFLFVSIKPSPARWHLRDRIVKTNDLVRAELATWPEAGYADVYHPMLGPDGRPRPELFEPDMLHLNPAGYRLWTERLSAERAKFT
ncbi:SGNH/GDSL hydrolase family protein [Fimbriiglobus ruber]|uniref:GDSL family lipase n=1 Tax=Fimbriiglobus ruber TaxID=1908690 RepID=A0A225DHP7_9BACT|nr:SGNH/GDSL hydrolase family protein [Fimbriiglobus ruber]OWK40493.1 GDSL family lipase [Fimbriiglobus ruber]